MSADRGGAPDALTAERIPAMATTTVKIDGMTCGACTSAVEGAFKSIDGAGDVSVSLIMGRAAIQHDPSILAPAKVAEMIEDCGFDAVVLSTEERIQTADAYPPSPRRPNLLRRLSLRRHDLRRMYICGGKRFKRCHRCKICQCVIIVGARSGRT